MAKKNKKIPKFNPIAHDMWTNGLCRPKTFEKKEVRPYRKRKHKGEEIKD